MPSFHQPPHSRPAMHQNNTITVHILPIRETTVIPSTYPTTPQNKSQTPLHSTQTPSLQQTPQSKHPCLFTRHPQIHAPIPATYIPPSRLHTPPRPDGSRVWYCRRDCWEVRLGLEKGATGLCCTALYSTVQRDNLSASTPPSNHSKSPPNSPTPTQASCRFIPYQNRASDRQPSPTQTS